VLLSLDQQGLKDMAQASCNLSTGPCAFSNRLLCYSMRTHGKLCLHVHPPGSDCLMSHPILARWLHTTPMSANNLQASSNKSALC
jgi:hypothetical protein